MKPIISKTPIPPILDNKMILFLTNTIFGKWDTLKACDLLFIFGGTHSGHWEKAIEAYQKGLVNTILVTGGNSLTSKTSLEWQENGLSEADVIRYHLLEAGIPKEVIIFENRSTNTLENVLYANEVFDFESISSLMFVCKSHVAARQWRTLAKHLPNHLTYVPYTFDAVYKNVVVSRDNWMTTEIGRSRVWGEYLRILYYGEKGDILKLE